MLLSHRMLFCQAQSPTIAGRFTPVPEPVLQASGLGVLYPKVVGKNHVRMVVTQGGLRFGSIGFNMGSIYQSLAMKNVKVDAAFSLNVNEWQGERTLQLNLKDLHY